MKLVFEFLEELKQNNNKIWFDANRTKYELAKKEFLLLVEAIITSLNKMDSELPILDPKKSIFRINRDVRFSKNKEPYKNNFGAWFSSKSGDNEKAGYYFHLEPGNTFVAGGIYQPSTEILKKIRQEIDYNYDEFNTIVTGSQFTKYFKGLEGDSLIRPPKGYEDDNPAIEFLKHKNFITSTKISNEMLYSKNLLVEILSRFESLIYFNHFLNKVF